MAGIHFSNIGVWRGRIKAFRALPIFNVSRQLRTPTQCCAIRANSQIPRHANPFRKKGVVQEAATRPCAQNARSFSERNGWHVGPAVIGIGAAKGLPHPAIFGHGQHDPPLEPLGRNVRRLAAPYAGRLSPSPSPVRLASRKSRALSGCTGSAPCCLHGPAAAEPSGSAAAWAKRNVFPFRTGSFPSRREPAR